MSSTDLATILGAVLAAVVAIVGAVLRSGSSTRDRIDALRHEVGGQLDAVRSDLAQAKITVAALGQRVGQLPAMPVDEASCRERHEAISQHLGRVRAGR